MRPGKAQRGVVLIHPSTVPCQTGSDPWYQPNPTALAAAKPMAALLRHACCTASCAACRQRPPTCGVALNAHEVRHVHRAWGAHPAQVIAQQVDDHQVLGPVLFRGCKQRGGGQLASLGLRTAIWADRWCVGR
jgi:hypothetical protein